MKEIITSLHNDFRDKMASPIYGIFIVAWAVFNWNFLYALFFLSEEKIWYATNGMLKNDYLLYRYFDFHSLFFYLKLIVPVGITYFLIWHFPKFISIPAYEKSEENNFQKKLIKNRLEILLGQQELEKAEIKEKKIEKEKEIVKSEYELEDVDYEKIKNHKLFPKIDQIIDSIYKESGDTSYWGNNGRLEKYIDSDVLAWMHANGFILIEGSGAKEKIELTERGKRFISKYLDERAN